MPDRSSAGRLAHRARSALLRPIQRDLRDLSRQVARLEIDIADLRDEIEAIRWSGSEAADLAGLATTVENLSTEVRAATDALGERVSRLEER